MHSTMPWVLNTVVTQVAQRKGEEVSLLMFIGLLPHGLLLEVWEQDLGEAHPRREALHALAIDIL